MTVSSTPTAAGRWIEGLTAEMPLSDALEEIFRLRWRAILHHLPLAAENVDGDTEHVHKLRVATRRLSAVLDVLAEGFPEVPRKRVCRLIDRIRKECGKARDLDVRRQFLESLLPQASVEDAAAIELLCEKAVRQRARAQKKLRRRLPPLGEKLRVAGEDLLGALVARPHEGRGGQALFGQTGRQTLQNELMALWRRAETDLESADTLHQLRIACKHLRYAFEIFIPVLHDSFREEFYPQLEHVQDLLGEIHDASQAMRALKRRRRKWKDRLKGSRGNGRLSGFRWSELRVGLDAILLAYAQQADQARNEFLDLWPDFSGEAFRIPVEELLGSAAAPAKGDLP